MNILSIRKIGLLRFEPRPIISKVDSRGNEGTEVKPLCLGKVRAVPRLCALHHGILLTTEEKSIGKTSVRVVEKC